MSEVFIVTGCRTPIGTFRKSLSSLSAPQLGAVTIREIVRRVGSDRLVVDEVVMGQVCQASCGQAPARQAALLAELPQSVPCTTVNKVCASGMKAVIVGCQSILCGTNEVVIAGGQESMSNIPFYLSRKEPAYGGAALVDGLLLDGLTDAFSNCHMGIHVEDLAKSLSIDRDAQDSFAKLSYMRSQQASESGILAKEIVPVIISGKKNGDGGELVVSEDEECHRTNFDKFSSLKPAFRADGTITAANASSLADGAASVLLASGKAVADNQWTPVAKVLGFADAAMEPEKFILAPAKAIKKLLEKHALEFQDIEVWEINEAFSVAVLANMHAMAGIRLDQTNVHGGAVSLGHPLGMSGARIVLHLAMNLRPGQKGIAAVCNGGGGGSAILLEGC